MEAVTTDVRTLPRLADDAATRERTLSAYGPQLIGGLALAGLILGLLVLVVAAAQGNTFLSRVVNTYSVGWLKWPFYGLWHSRTNDHDDVNQAFVFIMIAELAFYAVACRLASRLPAAVVWGTVVVIHIICFLAPPLVLTDVFNYIGYARMGVIHHLNPYTHTPLDVPGDGINVLSNWHALPSPYGPLFTLGTYALVPLGVATGYWVYKFLVMAAALGTLWLTARLARRFNVSPLLAVVFVGLNPLVVIYGTAGQHNDWFQMFLLLGAIELFMTRREAAGAIGMAGAAALKASAAILLPIYAVGTPNRRRAIGGTIAGVVFFGTLTLAAFGPHLPAIGIQSKLTQAFSIPNIFGIFVGAGAETTPIRDATDVALGIAMIACTVLAWRRREPVVALGWLSLVSLATIGWDMPWYILWLLPFMIFIRERVFRIAAAAVFIWMTIQWIPQMTNLAHHLGFRPEDQPSWVPLSHYVKYYLDS